MFSLYGTQEVIILIIINGQNSRKKRAIHLASTEKSIWLHFKVKCLLTPCKMLRPVGFNSSFSVARAHRNYGPHGNFFLFLFIRKARGNR